MSNSHDAELVDDPKFVHVEAQEDHLESLARAKPINALSELIWNGLDADADQVNVVVVENALGGTESIEISDNGSGIKHSDAKNAFGRLGGSWKKDKYLTAKSNKKMHGRDGKGRFKAFALGKRVTWRTTYLTEQGTREQYSIKGDSARLSDFEIELPTLANLNLALGTKVSISNIGELSGGLSESGSVSRQLAEIFALYLRNYPDTKIFFRGELVNPSSVQKSHTSIDLPFIRTQDGFEVKAKLDIVEWSFSKKERRICLCDPEGYMLHEVESGVRPGSEFNFTAYLRSDYIAKLHSENLLALEELNHDLKILIDEARNALRGHFRSKKAQSARELVQQWKTEGAYPFSGDATDNLEQARREVFDICALSVNEYLSSFREGMTRDRQFTLRMLKTALDENPESLKRILSEVLDLPKDKQSELADLLQYTTLSDIIEASKMVTDRLQFLSGLNELLFQQDLKKSVKERTQLHRMLEGETWLFGEEYLLTNSDENLNTVLRKHIDKLQPDAKSSRKKVSISRDDGSQAVIDLLLAREVATYAQTKRDYLVVELKRPSQRIDLKVKAQIESYGLAVANDERFDKKNTYWTFLAVSNEMTPEAARTINQQDKPYGFFHIDSNIKIGLATWSEILGGSRIRLEAFRTKLNYTATRDHGIAQLHSKYKQYLT